MPRLSLHQKRVLDTWVGLPCLLVLNFLARGLGAMLRRDHARLPAGTILISKFQGMGSLVIAKPALRRLRLEFPGSQIVFWGSPATALLAREMPEFDRCLVLDDSSLWAAATSLLQNLLSIWRLGPEWHFDLEVYSKLSSVLSALSCARNRAGFAVDSVKLRYCLHTHLVMFNRYGYLGYAYEKLLGLLTSPAKSGGAPDFGGWKARLRAPANLADHNYVVFNLHTGDLAPLRRWPVVSWQKLLDALLALDENLRVVLLGYGASEVSESALLTRHARLVDLSGQLTLAETLGCLANARLVISADSAPLHLALTTSAAVIGLYGPTRAEASFPEHRPGSVHLSEQLYCSPCVHHWEPAPCGGNNVCMKTLTVERVAAAAATLLGYPVPRSEEPETPGDNGEFYPGLVYGK